MPDHACLVQIILSLQTGHVSPQSHVYFDDMFKTIRDPTGVPQSYWQNKTGLQGVTTQRGRTRDNSQLVSHARSSASPPWLTEEKKSHE